MEDKKFISRGLLAAKGTRLFCLPYAGGGATIYRDWHRRVPDWIQVCPVELPGRGMLSADTPFESLSDLARELAAEIRNYEDYPFALLGHSMGALIAYEVARNLEFAGTRSLVHLFVSGARSPFLLQKRAPISNLPDHEFIAEMRKLGGTPEEILNHQELMNYLLPVLRADFRMIETYRGGSVCQIDIPVTAFSGARDADVSINDVEGWREVSTGRFKMVTIPGGHFFINFESVNIIREVINTLSEPL